MTAELDLEAIGVEGSTPRRVLCLMQGLGYELVGIVDADHTSRVGMRFDSGDHMTTITYEDTEKAQREPADPRG